MKMSLALTVILFSSISFAKSCGKKDINCLMKSKLVRMNQCYKRVLGYTSQDLDLNVKVKFEVKKDGDPTNFHFHVSEYHKAIRKGMFTKCLQDSIEAINFPRPTYSNQYMVYKSFNFIAHR